MRSLATSGSVLEAAPLMRDTAFTRACGTAAERPDVARSVLCIYCRTDRFVYWPPAIRLPSADCPGCRQREPVGRYPAPLKSATRPALDPLPAVTRQADDQ